MMTRAEASVKEKHQTYLKLTRFTLQSSYRLKNNEDLHFCWTVM